MIKAMSAILVIIASAIVCPAQQNPEKFAIGLHAGWGIWDITKSHFTYKGGFAGGVSATFNLTKNVHLQPEVNFQQQGARYRNKMPVNVNEYKEVWWRLNYLNIPVLLKYSFGTTNLSVFAGPQVGFNLNAKEIIEDYEAHSKDNYRTVDFSGVGGLEYSVPVPGKKQSLVVNARHFSGFTDYTREFSLVPSPGGRWRYRGFALMIGLRF